jgi:nucleoside-diphosphate-sugar epimerase
MFRFSMPYGPGHPPGYGRAAITNFIWNAMERQPITVHRGSERSWCWIGDTVRGARLVLESGLGGAWNVGRDDIPTPMVEVAELACELAGAPRDLVVEIDPPTQQTVVKRLAADKLRTLGWQPEVELEEGMRRTLEWLEWYRHEPSGVAETQLA